MEDTKLVIDTGEVIMTEKNGDTDHSDDQDNSASGAVLTSEEETATKKFLENVNKWRTAQQLEAVSVSMLENNTKMSETL